MKNNRFINQNMSAAGSKFAARNILVSALLLGGLLLTGCNSFLTPNNKTAGGQTAGKYFDQDPATLRV